jgi:hypothetical protein
MVSWKFLQKGCGSRDFLEKKICTTELQAYHIGGFFFNSALKRVQREWIRRGSPQATLALAPGRNPMEETKL